MLSSENKPWFQAYKAAMLELDRQKLPERTAAANAAVQLRLKEIRATLITMRNGSKLQAP